MIPDNSTYMVKDYICNDNPDMGTVERVYESFAGSYWIITDTSDAHPFGYVHLASHPQFAEWGYVNPRDIERSNVWEVPKENWSFTGPDSITLSTVE